MNVIKQLTEQILKKNRVQRYYLTNLTQRFISFLPAFLQNAIPFGTFYQYFFTRTKRCCK